MYPFIRYASTIVHAAIKARQGDTLTLDGTSEIRFRCRLTDIDNFLEMNNGRVLTLYDLGRTDFAVRTGLGTQLLKQRWAWWSLAVRYNTANAFAPLIKW